MFNRYDLYLLILVILTGALYYFGMNYVIGG